MRHLLCYLGIHNYHIIRSEVNQYTLYADIFYHCPYCEKTIKNKSHAIK